MRKYTTAFALGALLTFSSNAHANCRAEIEGSGNDQAGSIALFWSGKGGISHPELNSEYWALTGPSDFFQLRAFPVRLTAEQRLKFGSLLERVNPIVLNVKVNGVVENGAVWLEVKKIFPQYSEDFQKLVDARPGTCGSYFRSGP